jgi:hypothetical protein
MAVSEHGRPRYGGQSGARTTVPKAVVVVSGEPDHALADALDRLAARHAGLVLCDLDAASPCPPLPTLPDAFRLAWLCVNAADTGLPAVHDCFQQLRAMAPVIVACLVSGTESMAGDTAWTGFSGGIIQPYTAGQLPLVTGVLDSFMTGR